MISFTIYGLFTKMLYDGDWRKTPKYTKDETKEKFSVWLPFHPPVYKEETNCFPVSENTENYPKWERVPNLIGQGWARYRQLMAGNMDFIHVKFQDPRCKK